MRKIHVSIGVPCAIGLVAGVILLAGCPVGPQIQVPPFVGPYDVAVYNTRLTEPQFANSAPVTIHYPSDDGVKLKTEGGPWPVVIFAPGFNVPQSAYWDWGQQIASWGFIVHIAHYTGFNNVATTEDMSHHLDWMLAQNDVVDGPFEGLIDTEKVGCAGHSMGGKYVVMACIFDDRFDCAVSIDPVDAAAAFGPPFPLFPSITPDRMDEVGEPILYLGTTLDSLFSPGDENFHEFFIHSTAYAQEIEFQVGDHVSFAGALAGDLAAILHLPFGSTPEFDILVQNYAVRYSVAWLKVHLEGDTSFETHLTGPDAQQDVADGWILFDTIN